MQASKLALAALLSGGVVVGATRSSLVQDRMDSRVMEDIGSLLQAQGYTRLEIMNFATQGVTPGVKDSMDEAVSDAITEIKQNIETKIKSGHAATQSAIKISIGDLKATTARALNQKQIANQADEDWYSCISKEKAAAAKFEGATKTLAEAKLKVVTPCQQQSDRAHISMSLVPENMKFGCDISGKGNCDSRMTSYQTQVEDMMKDLFDVADSKVTSWVVARDACTDAEETRRLAQEALDRTRKSWQTQRATCKSQNGHRVPSMCLFGTDLRRACEAVTAYQSLLHGIDAANGGEYSHHDRLQEWKTSQVTKCLLGNVRDGVKNRAGSVHACETSVNFDKDVGVLDKRQAEFAALRNAATLPCSEQAISFYGETWQFPNGDDVNSSAYVSKAYEPSVSFTADSLPFDFCN